MSMAEAPIPLCARDLADWLVDPRRPRPLLLDVREEWEFEHCHLAGAVHVPMAQIPARIGELEDAAEIVCICHHGVRSLQVAHYLVRQCQGKVFNLQGGVEAWAQDVDTAMPRY